MDAGFGETGFRSACQDWANHEHAAYRFRIQNGRVSEPKTIRSAAISTQRRRRFAASDGPILQNSSWTRPRVFLAAQGVPLQAVGFTTVSSVAIDKSGR